ncbi:thiosulfate/3-mercaptopyruvate sulfurtransferase [Sphaerotilus sulfidivorans]|uniref:Sulfurtransferase n=1 Tax=Sphaerotilus sulfidivorans TaxID=639200 RepID=A0A5C1PVW3_9BURK|nr:sulfurtransferase [Sphaerotilus sulfidivorans]NZD47442.1 sulfurtransferase [Sphaerotilus sulfidivorans]QEM99882.1 sulfurtransferase [Sphaerotilus sulfidivorans]
MTISPDFSSPLISAEALKAALGRVRVFDVRFDLARPDAGEAAWREAHLPGAHYLHLDRDLSAKDGVPALCGGRHPLPTREVFAATAARLGLTPDTPVVLVDAQGGMFAARAWWMLRWIGARDVRVLDGGLAAWRAAGGALEPGEVAPAAPGPAWPLGPEPEGLRLTADALAAQLGRVALLDARAPERYRGDVEPLDPVAGHIPGALNRPFSANLGPDGRFLPPEALRAAFQGLAGARPVVHQCGSGVTACHNLLAMAVAGLPGGALYAGSWSEWCRDPARPVAQG